MTTFLARIYAFKFFDAFMLIFPLYAVMFVDAGLTPVQIAVCLTVWSGTNFALQIPSGVLADRVSRKGLLAFAQIARAAGFGIWLVSPHFWGFLAGLVLWGVKSAFTSGTFEALTYDALSARDRAEDYPRVIGRARAAQAAAVVSAALGAAAAAGHGYALCILASVVSGGVATIAALALPPAPLAASTAPRRYMDHLSKGLGLAFRQPPILNILVFSALILAFGGVLEEFWPIFGARVGLSRPAIALFVSAQNVVEALAAVLAWRTGSLSAAWFYGLFAFSGGLLLIAASLFTPASMALLALYSGVMALIGVVFEARLQQLIPSDRRATLGSVKSFIAQIGLTGLYLSFGPIAQATSYRIAFLACGAAGIVCGVVYLGASAAFAGRAAQLAKNCQNL